MRKDLSEWELSLKPYINHIKLLGEIPITHIEVEHIGNLIRDLKNQYNQRRATFLLETKYPFTFVMYLASLAAHNTDRDYWRVVSESTGFNIQRMRQLEWGPIFLKILKDNNLPTFHSVGGYRYVTPIRLHGGIPAYSLPDFFGYILWPSITRQSYKNLSSKDVVNGILKRTTVQISVDSPVTNFLENGGEYAIEFFDRCRQMARRYNQSQDIPDPIEINLPPYVVRSFQQFVEEELETDTGRRLRAPQLFIDPWGPDFYINLPPEPVDALQSTHHYHWQVEMHMSEKENHTLTEPVRVRRRGYDLETSDLNIPLENPAEHIIVSYCNQDSYQKSDPKKNIKTIRRWRLNLLPDEEQPPLLAFNPLNGRLIRWQQTLPAEELWLVSPNDVEIHLDGEGEVIETFPDFFGAWGQWSVESWDLSQSISIQLKQNGKGIKAPIPILSAPPEPVLVGNNTLRNDVDPDGVPVYIGESPSIRFPIRPGRHADTELSSWQLKIESRWAASPEFHHELFQISEFKSNIHALSNEFEFPLSTLLGNNPCGTYRVVVMGPYGLRVEFRFRVWTSLTIEGLENYYLPTKDGAQKVRFTIQIPQGCEVAPQAGVEGIFVEHTGDKFQISVDPGITVANLHLISVLPDKDPIRLPLSLAIPRLRWSLILEQDESAIEWYANPIQTTVDALLQSKQGTIYFELPLIDELPLILNVVLVNPETNEPIQKHSSPKGVSFRQTRWRYPLGEFFDTFRSLEKQPVFEFLLVLENTISRETIEIPIIRLNRTLDIHTVWVEFYEDSTFCLRWVEINPLRNRRVRIWSDWQPWNPPIELPIPDENRGELDVKDVRLLPSHYRMHFLTAAPWDPPNPPNEPPRDSISVETTTPRERLKWIHKKLDTESKQPFLLHFEHACVLEESNIIEGRNREIEWCCNNMENCTPDQIFAFHEWVESRDPESQTLVRTFMYKPDQIQYLFSVYPENHHMRISYLNYFSGTETIESKSALMVLDNVNDPGSVMHALIILINKKHPLALNRIFGSIENGQLSELDAGELLSLNPEFTLTALGKLQESQLKIRMIERMANRIPDQEYFVITNFWVRTNAGWGYIEDIRDKGNEDKKPYFIREQDNPILFVILRPDDHPERIIVNLEDETITFEEANQVWICTKENCFSFASQNEHCVIYEHNRASHMGLGPALRPLDPTFPMFTPEDYSLEPPENPFS